MTLILVTIPLYLLFEVSIRVVQAINTPDVVMLLYAHIIIAF